MDKRLRRRLLAIAAVAGLLAAATAIVRPGVTAADPNQAFASGSGQVSYPDFPLPGGEPTTDRFSFTAHIGPDGSAKGSIVIHSNVPGFEHMKADVTCAVIVGNRARVGGVLREQIPFAGLQIYAVALVLEDNGPPGQSVDRADVWSFIARPGRDDQTPCTFPLPPASRPVERGNVNIGGHQGAHVRVVG